MAGALNPEAGKPGPLGVYVGLDEVRKDVTKDTASPSAKAAAAAIAGGKKRTSSIALVPLLRAVATLRESGGSPRYSCAVHRHARTG